MQTSSLVYGLFKDVKSRCSRAVTQLRRGVRWEEILSSYPTIDTNDTPGLLAIDGPSPLLGGSPHFHLFAPLRVLDEARLKGRLSRDAVDAVVAASMGSAWGLLGLLGRNHTMLVHPPELRPEVLAAAMRFWPEYEAVGPRYTMGSNHGEELWKVPNNVHFVLANLGVPNERLREPLPPGGIASLLPSS